VCTANQSFVSLPQDNLLSSFTSDILSRFVYCCVCVPDFWTTRCTRCPAALDKLQALASNSSPDDRYANVQFISICCDSLDGAREIIERDDEIKWPDIQNYFMSVQDKETAKQILGFAAVPFYVFVSETGEITQSGNKVDWDRVPGMIPDQENVVAPVVQEKQLETETAAVVTPNKPEMTFVLDELDF
jgi:hypothetical protein